MFSHTVAIMAPLDSPGMYNDKTLHKLQTLVMCWLEMSNRQNSHMDVSDGWSSRNVFGWLVTCYNDHGNMVISINAVDFDDSTGIFATDCNSLESLWNHILKLHPYNWWKPAMFCSVALSPFHHV